MKLKSRKAFTLVEMIVSIALIALVSIALLGMIVPAANQQGKAEERNVGLNAAAQVLEEKDFSNPGVSSQGYSLNLGNNITCTGTLYRSADESGVELREFVPPSDSQ